MSSLPVSPATTAAPLPNSKLVKITAEVTLLPTVVDLHANAGDRLMLLGGVVIGVMAPDTQVMPLAPVTSPPPPPTKQSLQVSALTSREEIRKNILSVLSEHGPMTALYLADAIGLPRRDRFDFRKVLMILVRSGKIQQGPGRYAEYSIKDDAGAKASKSTKANAATAAISFDTSAP